jgi:two-component system, cell cycle response regulator
MLPEREPREREGGPEAQQPERILIVDDHEDNVELLRARLESWGYRTESVMDGRSAIAAIERNPPDLVLLDVMMPDLDGKEVARRVKGNPALPFVPIIMQTALDATESKVEGLEAGADDYITKPIDFAELKARLRSMLRIKRLQEALEHANLELRRVSQTDGLTGLHNRRHIEERLEELFEHAKRLKEPFACVLCDIDKFKSVNDEHGHQAGDAVLRQFAQILRDEARVIDQVGRYGGEEFMLLLPGASSEDALDFSERVRKAVEAHTFTFDGVSLHRTASFGVAGWPHPRIADCDCLVRAADDALYAAKETGRNRVVRYDSDEFNAHIKADANEQRSDLEPGAERDVPRAVARDVPSGGERREADAPRERVDQRGAAHP